MRGHGVLEAKRPWRGGRSRTIVAMAATVVIAALAAGAVACGGGKGDKGTPSATGSSRASAAATATPASAGLKTPIATSPGDELTAFDLAQRGAGEPARGEFSGVRLIVPKIGVDAPFSLKTVPSSGQMPNPNSWDDVAYYDFSGFAGMGGVPGKGGNVVVAGHVDYIGHGPAVFWDLHKLAVGDRVQIRMQDGTMIEYAVEFNKRINADKADWQAIAAGTKDESITLITCGGKFSAGRYSDRQIIWGRRVS